MAALREQSGIALLTDVLMPRRIRFRDSHFVCQDGRHTICGIELSEDLRASGTDADGIARLAESVLSLYYRAEKEKGLRAVVAQDAVLRGYLPDAHLSGMTFLNLFTRGVLRLLGPSEENGEWTFSADPILQSALPDAERKMDLLMKTVLSFGKDRVKYRIVFEPGPLVRTDRLAENMSLTYDWDRAFEQTYILGESPESAETEREKAVRLNREASLRKTLELIRVINEEAAPEKEEEAPKHD